jgi:hypothetical protein
MINFTTRSVIALVWDGQVEAIRALMVAKRTVRAQRIQTNCQARALGETGCLPGERCDREGHSVVVVVVDDERFLTAFRMSGQGAVSETAPPAVRARSCTCHPKTAFTGSGWLPGVPRPCPGRAG